MNVKESLQLFMECKNNNKKKNCEEKQDVCHPWSELELQECLCQKASRERSLPKGGVGRAGSAGSSDEAPQGASLKGGDGEEEDFF